MGYSGIGSLRTSFDCTMECSLSTGMSSRMKPVRPNQRAAFLCSAKPSRSSSKPRYQLMKRVAPATNSVRRLEAAEQDCDGPAYEHADANPSKVPDSKKVNEKPGETMNDLLTTAVNAHGGLKRWNEIKSIQVAAHITGAIWFVKSQGDYLKDIVMSVDTRKERMVTDFPGQDKRIRFEPSQIVMEKADGTLIQVRDNPEASFVGQQR